MSNGGVPGCVVKPEQTEGPYYVDQQLNRSDIRTEPSTGEVKAGEVLTLAMAVSELSGGQCRPLPGATVDLWQCDAQGVYWGVNDPATAGNTVGMKVLRGFQTTDSGGNVRFTTIYPGWYSGRTVHVHFKIRAQAPTGAYEFTSQLYFDETLNTQILAGPRYARPGQRDTFNATDGIYRDGGSQLTLNVTRAGGSLAAAFAIGLDLSDANTGRPDGMGRGGPGRGGGRPGGPGRGGPGAPPPGRPGGGNP